MLASWECVRFSPTSSTVSVWPLIPVPLSPTDLHFGSSAIGFCRCTSDRSWKISGSFVVSCVLSAMSHIRRAGLTSHWSWRCGVWQILRLRLFLGFCRCISDRCWKMSGSFVVSCLLSAMSHIRRAGLTSHWSWRCGVWQILRLRLFLGFCRCISDRCWKMSGSFVVSCVLSAMSHIRRAGLTSHWSWRCGVWQILRLRLFLERQRQRDRNSTGSGTETEVLLNVI